MEQTGQQTQVEEELRQKLYELQLTSQRDALTGLWNRSYLMEQVDSYLQEEEHQGALFMLDLDNFKMVNDSYGHIMGDACLVALAERMKGFVRGQDIVSRLGGDEFILFFKGHMSEQTVDERASSLINTLREEFCRMDIQGKVSASIGIAIAPENGHEFMELYQKADKALYHIKNRGKNNYCFYSDGRERDAAAREEKSKKADMELIKRVIMEHREPHGAYQVEYDGFKRIYQFLSRYLDRSRQNIQLVLFTLSGRKGELPESQILSGVLYELESVIKESLRVGDVATNYSSTQFLVILMDATAENANMVAERIVKRFYEPLQMYGMKLEYDIDRIKSENLQK